jgi:hypothetical protein
MGARKEEQRTGSVDLLLHDVPPIMYSRITKDDGITPRVQHTSGLMDPMTSLITIPTMLSIIGNFEKTGSM